MNYLTSRDIESATEVASQYEGIDVEELLRQLNRVVTALWTAYHAAHHLCAKMEREA